MKQSVPTAAPSIRLVAFASSVGATIEWYDFFLYGVVTPLVFNKLFFPNYDPVVGTLLAYTTFFVGFVSRPIGGIIFGHLGDRLGRKGVLILTLMIMGVATFLISGHRHRGGMGRRRSHGRRACAGKPPWVLW